MRPLRFDGGVLNSCDPLRFRRLDGKALRGLVSSSCVSCSIVCSICRARSIEAIRGALKARPCKALDGLLPGRDELRARPAVLALRLSSIAAAT